MLRRKGMGDGNSSQKCPPCLDHCFMQSLIKIAVDQFYQLPVDMRQLELENAVNKCRSPVLNLFFSFQSKEQASLCHILQFFSYFCYRLIQPGSYILRLFKRRTELQE